LPPPVVDSVSPTSGTELGNTAVTITGSGFTNSIEATINGNAITSFLVVDDTTITGNTPAGTVGAQTVRVTNSDAQFDELVGGFTYITADPTEWAGVTPWMDWDPADATTVSGVDLTIVTQPDSSGNGRDAAQAAPGSYPFALLPMPVLVENDARFNNANSISFEGNPNIDAQAPALVTPTLPSGPLTIAIVAQTDMPDHGLMAGGGGAGAFTNNYVLSAEADALGVYADGAASRAFGGWLDSGYAEPTRSVDFASNPHVLILRSTGESGGAGDSVTSLFANSLTPTVVGSRPTFAGGACVLGSYQGGMIYVLQGAVARIIIWTQALTDLEVATSLNALGSKYNITIGA
jgi:hypothetical protein